MADAAAAALNMHPHGAGGEEASDARSAKSEPRAAAGLPPSNLRRDIRKAKTLGADSQGAVQKRRISWRDMPPNVDTEVNQSLSLLGTGDSPSCRMWDWRRSPTSGCESDGTPSSANSGPQRKLSTRSLERIHDRRTTPSRDDHEEIIDTFQNGLAHVESVFVYDHPDHATDGERESGVVGAAISRFRHHRCLGSLGAVVLAICGALELLGAAFDQDPFHRHL